MQFASRVPGAASRRNHTNSDTVACLQSVCDPGQIGSGKNTRRLFTTLTSTSGLGAFDMQALDGSRAMRGNDLRCVGTHPDHWYPLAWSHELKAGKTLGRQFAGDPVVLYRGASGAVYALEDRCAHRQVPLHL